MDGIWNSAMISFHSLMETWGLVVAVAENAGELVMGKIETGSDWGGR